MKCRLFLLIIVLALAGCAGVIPIPAGKTVQIGDGVSVTPDSDWNQIAGERSKLWTVNGLGLDGVMFSTAIAPGRPIYPVPGVREAELGRYNSEMLPNDIEDLVVATMGKEGLTNVRARNLTPCPFGTVTGFCFDLDFADKDGLLMRGKAIAVRNGKNLELVEYRAPAEYYYDLMAPAVSRLFAALKVE